MHVVEASKNLGFFFFFFFYNSVVGIFSRPEVLDIRKKTGFARFLFVHVENLRWNIDVIDLENRSMHDFFSFFSFLFLVEKIAVTILKIEKKSEYCSRCSTSAKTPKKL